MAILEMYYQPQSCIELNNILHVQSTSVSSRHVTCRPTNKKKIEKEP